MTKLIITNTNVADKNTSLQREQFREMFQMKKTSNKNEIMKTNATR